MPSDDLLVGGQGPGGADAAVGDRLLRAHELDGAPAACPRACRAAGGRRRGTRSVAGAQAEGGGQAEPDGSRARRRGRGMGPSGYTAGLRIRGAGRTAAAKSHVPSGRGESAKWTVRRRAPCAITSRSASVTWAGVPTTRPVLHGPDVRRGLEALQLALGLGDQDAHAQDLADPS